MTRRLTTRLARLEDAVLPMPGEEPLCVHHGPACAMGTEPLAEIYVMAIEAKRRAGEDVPPLDEHRPMTPVEAAQYRREYAEALAEAKARNAAIEAELTAGESWT